MSIQILVFNMNHITRTYFVVVLGLCITAVLTSCSNEVCKTEELPLPSGTLYFHDLTWRSGWDDNNSVFISTVSECSMDNSSLVFNSNSYGYFHYFLRNDSLVIVSPEISKEYLLKSDLAVKIEKVTVSEYIERKDTLKFYGYYFQEEE